MVNKFNFEFQISNNFIENKTKIIKDDDKTKTKLELDKKISLIRQNSLENKNEFDLEEYDLLVEEVPTEEEEEQLDIGERVSLEKKKIHSENAEKIQSAGVVQWETQVNKIAEAMKDTLKTIQEKRQESLLQLNEKESKIANLKLDQYGKYLKGESVKKNLESKQQLVTSTEKAVESTEKAVESTEKAVESTEKAVESTEKAVESTEKAVESTEKTVESTEKAVESTEKAVESTEKTVESTEKTVESMEKSVAPTREEKEYKKKEAVSKERTVVSTEKTVESTEKIVESVKEAIGSARKNIETRENEINQRLVCLVSVKIVGHKVVSNSKASDHFDGLKREIPNQYQNFIYKKCVDDVWIARCPPNWVEENSRITHLVQDGISYKIEKMTEEDVKEVVALLNTYFDAVSQLQELEVLLKTLIQATSKPKKVEEEFKVPQGILPQRSQQRSHSNKSSHKSSMVEQKKGVSPKEDMKGVTKQMQAIKKIRKSSKKREEILEKHLKEQIKHKELRRELEAKEDRENDQKGV